MDRSDTPTAVLRDEHRVIIRVVDALERTMDRGRDGDPPLGDLEDCVIFFRSFADACHHGKEEDLLFSELEEHGVPGDRGPIAVMLHEHRMGRRYVSEMGAALEGLREGENLAWNRFVRSGREYVALMRGHIGKEDGFLFEMADGVLAGPACARLCARYEEVCSRRFSGRTKEDLEALAERLVARTTQGT